LALALDKENGEINFLSELVERENGELLLLLLFEFKVNGEVVLELSLLLIVLLFNRGLVTLFDCKVNRDGFSVVLFNWLSKGLALFVCKEKGDGLLFVLELIEESENGEELLLLPNAPKFGFAADDKLFGNFLSCPEGCNEKGELLLLLGFREKGELFLS